jgi:ABC-type sugar transport system permease subunit
MAKHVRRRSNYRVPWLFALPAVLYMGAFLLYPLLSALRISFSEYNFVYSEKPIFNGLANYVQLFNDPHFIVSFKNTVYYTLVFFPLFMLLSLFLAFLLSMLMCCVQDNSKMVIVNSLSQAQQGF